MWKVVLKKLGFLPDKRSMKMKIIQIQEGKALKAVKSKGTTGRPCKECFFENAMKQVNYEKKKCICRDLVCSGIERADGKDVSFELIDSP